MSDRQGLTGKKLPALMIAFLGLLVVGSCHGTSSSQTLESVPAVHHYYAAIDMGSSGAKLLVQEAKPDGSLVTVKDVRLSTKLGEGVANGSAIPSGNIQRTKLAIQSLTNNAHDDYGVDPSTIALIATAVTRNASNGRAFMDTLNHELGLTRGRILSGDDEARYGYLGTIAGFRRLGSSDDRYATLDLGGGSFQLAVGTRDAFELGGSTQIGSNQIVDLWLPGGILTEAQFSAADAGLFKKAPMPLAVDKLRGRKLVGTGSISKFLAAYFGTSTLKLDAIDRLRKQLGSMALEDRKKVLKGDRPQVVLEALGLGSEADANDYAIKSPASITLLLHIMRSLGVSEMQVSETDARYALISEIAAKP
ncbi:MAG: hypothetical protein H7249_04110 [Chitinophagaceae bacterium]|nr:hypothetical protein [Oligoflexus sp.]